MQKRIALVLILFSAVLLVACSNPRGGLGPAWDVGFKVPLSNGHRFDIDEVFSGEGFDDTGPLLSFGGEEAMETMDIGSSLTDIDLPERGEIIQNILLPEISLENLLNDSVNTGIPENVDGTGAAVGVDDIIIPIPFDITFSGNTENQLELAVTAPASFGIDFLELSVLGQKVTFGPLTPGEVSSVQVISLTDQVLNDDLIVTVDRLVTPESAGGLGSTDLMTLAYRIPRAEVVSISNYDLAETSLTATTALSLHDLGLEDLEFEIKAITFERGILEIGLTPPDGDLNFDIKTIKVGSLLVEEGNNDLTGEVIEFTPALEVVVDFTVSGTRINYHAGEAVAFVAGFTDPVVEEVSAVINNLSAADILPPDFKNPLLELPEVEQDIQRIIDEITFNNLDLELVITNNIGSDLDPGELIADFSNIQFVARDSAGELIDNAGFLLGDLDLNAGEIGRGKTTISLVKEGVVDFLDLLSAYPAEVEVLVNEGGFSIDSNGKPVTIDNQSTIDLSLKYNLGFDLTVNDDIENLYYERISFEGLKADELADKVFDSARLVMVGFDNQLPVEVALYFYIADIPDENNLSDSEFEERLFQDSNKLATSLLIEAETAEPLVKEVILGDRSILDRFTGENLFFGIKYLIPAGSYQLEPDDYLKVDSIYSSFVFKINH